MATCAMPATSNSWIGLLRADSRAFFTWGQATADYLRGLALRER
jgi:hypothetical protein